MSYPVWADRRVSLCSPSTLDIVDCEKAVLWKLTGHLFASSASKNTACLTTTVSKGIRLLATMANVTDLQTKYSKLAQEYSKVKRLINSFTVFNDQVHDHSTVVDAVMLDRRKLICSWLTQINDRSIHIDNCRLKSQCWTWFLGLYCIDSWCAQND